MQGGPPTFAAADWAKADRAPQAFQVGLNPLGPAIRADEHLGSFQQTARLDGAIQARMADLVETRAEHVLGQTAEEFHWMDGGGAALLGGERDLLAGAGLDP